MQQLVSKRHFYVTAIRRDTLAAPAMQSHVSDHIHDSEGDFGPTTCHRSTFAASQQCERLPLVLLSDISLMS